MAEIPNMRRKAAGGEHESSQEKASQEYAGRLFAVQAVEKERCQRRSESSNLART